MTFAKKKFGQNFLVDQNVIDAIVSTLRAKPIEHFIEIGPGRGALTEPLLQKQLDLSVIEIDTDLVKQLLLLQKHHPQFMVYAQDALAFSFTEQGPKHWRVVGNLPYYISSALLLHCFSEIDGIVDMHFMLQNEVVNRLCAAPGNKEYGRLSVMTQYYCTVEKLFEVFPESFFPQPKVVSAFFRLTPKKERLPVDVKKLARVTQEAFGQRRKTLRNSLGKLFSAEQLINLNIDPMRRAETLSLEEFCLLARAIN